MKRLDPSLLEGLEQAVRANRTTDVRAYLEGLKAHKIARSDKVKVANLARRTGLVRTAVVLLSPLARHLGTGMTGSAAERAEYAACLVSVGSVSEALEILEGIPERAYSDALLFRAFAYFSTWDYERAIPYLKRYCELVSGDRYRWLVGQVNLIASLVFVENSGEASRLIAGAVSTAKELEAVRLLGNCTELSAQLALYKGDFDRCEKHLDRASVGISALSPEFLFLKKWRAVLVLKKGKRGAGLELLKKVRQEALKRGHWETFRDCEFHQAIHTRNPALATHLYFGTPHEAYRRKLLRDSGSWFTPPASYVWGIGPGTPTRVFDTDRGLEVPKGARVNAGRLVHRCIRAMASDFYRPQRPLALYSQLFPGEFFNMETSIDRVHHAVQGTRKWFARARIPLKIFQEGGQYRLGATDSYGLRKTLETEPTTPERVLLRRLRPVFRNTLFSSVEAGAALGVSKRSAIRVLNEALSLDLLEPHGAGPMRRYRIK